MTYKQRVRRWKIKGAIEALRDLLEHARAHLYEVDDDAVYHYLKATEKALVEEETGASNKT